MAAVSAPGRARTLHPVQAILLAFPFPLFLAALVSDFAYWGTFQIQWANFASWLIAGGLLGGAGAVLWALVDLFRFWGDRSSWRLIYFALLTIMWPIGFINALVHAKDAWAIMPESLSLSVVTMLLALAAALTGYSGARFWAGGVMLRALLLVAFAALLVGCSDEPEPLQFGAEPDLPQPYRRLCLT